MSLYCLGLNDRIIPYAVGLKTNDRNFRIASTMRDLLIAFSYFYQRDFIYHMIIFLSVGARILV